MAGYEAFDVIESIGRNCEFGAIQRDIFETEPISLLRWAGSNSKLKLARGFRTRFAGLGAAMTGRGDPPDAPAERQHYWLTDVRHDIVFHTPCRVADCSVEEARRLTAPRLRRLAEILVQRIEGGERLFLYTDNEATEARNFGGLFEAFRTIGPAWMLAVMQNPGRAGTAHLVREGLIAGYVEYLTERGQANTYRWPSWEDMLGAALGIHGEAHVPVGPV